MKYSLSLVALIAVNLVACSPRAPETQASQASKDSVSREHCIAKGNNASCFLEVETDGSSKFYAPSRDYSTLVTNPVLADMNVPMKEISTEDYAEMVNKYIPATVVYNQDSTSSVEAFANTSLNDSPGKTALNGWWSDMFRKVGAGIVAGIGGIVPGIKRGAEQGSAYPGAGKIIGAIGGAILGALQKGIAAANAVGKSTNGKVQVNYHFGDQTIQGDDLTIAD